MGLPALLSSTLGLLQSKVLFLKEHDCFTPHLREEFLSLHNFKITETFF